VLLYFSVAEKYVEYSAWNMALLVLLTLAALNLFPLSFLIEKMVKYAE